MKRKNKLNERSQKLKSISIKKLSKDLINKFSIFNGENIFLQEYLKII